MFDWVNLILGIIIIVLLLIFLIKLTPKDQKKSSTKSYTAFIATTESEVSNKVKNNQYDGVRFVKINRRTFKNKEAQYRPGIIGLSDISKAIKKDYGAILSRRTRKHYEKKYGIPFMAYRGL